MSTSTAPSSRRTRAVLVLASAAVAGGLLGWLCSTVILVSSPLALIPWAVAGVALGWLARSFGFAALVGAVYGFVLGVAFMIGGYAGAAPLVAVLPAFAALGLAAAVGGLVCSELGAGVRRMLRRGTIADR
ncbi:hypothetical protein [Microbacterium deminutum]|uniref:Histidinol dehydrogenase n=1 Tax=Microbacterium deminutum TaxID=344164 RepID=A0ABP5CDD1_9MICO